MRRLVVTVVLLAVLCLLPAGRVSAQEPSGELTLLSQTSWVPANGVFEVGVGVGGVADPTQFDVEFTVHAPVRSRSEFTRTLDGALLGSVVADAVVAVGPDGAAAVTFTQPAAGAVPGTAMGDLDPGVYPVEIVLRERTGGVVVDDLTTHLLRSHDDPAMPPLSVGVVIPFSAPPALSPDRSVELAADDLEALDATSSAVDIDGLPLTLVPTPETVEALVDLGRDDILDGLRRSVERGSQVVARPYVDLSTATLLAPGLSDEVDAQRLRGVAVVGEHLDDRPGPPVLTSAGPVDEVLAMRIGDLGYAQAVLGERALEPVDPALTGNRTLVNPFLVDHGEGTLPAASVDPALAGYFRDTDDEILAAHHLLADLAVLFGDAPGLERGTVVMPPAGWKPSGPFLETVLAGLAAGPTVAPVTVDDLLGGVPLLTDPDTDEPVVRRLAPEPAEGDDAVAAPSVREERANVAAIAGVAGPDDAGLAALERLLLVSQAEGLTTVERVTYAARVGAEVAAVVDRVEVSGRSAYRLTAREGTIPVTLRNENDFRVEVRLRLASDKLEFDDAVGPNRSLLEQTVSLEPGRNTIIQVQVTARTSGGFPLTINLASPDGRLDIDSARVTVRSTVASGVGVALSIGAGVFLLVWWGRHWRTARRARRLVDPDLDPDELLAAVSADPHDADDLEPTP